MPLVHRCGGVNCDVFRLGLPPATLGVREKLVDNPMVVAIDPETISITLMGPSPVLSTYCILSV